MPTLTRPLTLNEFLLAKRPQTPSEILSCLGYFLQEQSDTAYVLTLALVEEQLRFAPFKIADIPAALHDASENLALFSRYTEDAVVKYRLTAKGKRMVEQLP